MKFSRLVIPVAISVFLAFGLPSARAQNEPQAAKQETVATQAAPLKERHIPLAPGPGTRVQGKVILRIVVDAKGNVSEAKALSGGTKVAIRTSYPSASNKNRGDFVWLKGLPRCNI